MVLTLIRFLFVFNRILWRACRSLRFTCGERSWAVDSEGDDRKEVRPPQKARRD